ncbi:acetyl-CoA carboxylase biotin carboxylase subunit [Candidatus Calescamantes bacterium]|nr:acetyl-CoA carboxylase biotin carboxylase subunit [Candidatus Calescamantes bacterium]
MFSRVLVANRGEIALRIIRTLKEMDITSIAVFSEADRDSLHVRMADEAICIGPPQTSESYLNMARIISAAEVADAEAIHPGYGFLAENAHFAEVCASCNIVFIGPPPEAIRKMGDKVEARKTMKEAGIPVIPGSEGVVETPEEAIKVARSLGYPVMVKAQAGGGGKGMRIAHNDGKLVSIFHTAQREAEAAFGNPGVYIEKYIENPRHVEVQILADKHGNIVFLGERDCSIQRRYQKLIEESPSPIVDEELRKKLGEAAVKAAGAIGYEGAGTIEFLVDREGNFYFMEMNTRLQVEHPVTEMITGFDLVKEQVRIAAGESISFTQEDVKMVGWAIECRINAEDPDQDFLPSTGKVTKYIPPGGPFIRVDSHLYEGYTIPPYYDSLISKVITWGKTREEAIDRMCRALSEYVIEGIHTTIPFHLRILNEPDFREGLDYSSLLDRVIIK